MQIFRGGAYFFEASMKPLGCVEAGLGPNMKAFVDTWGHS